MLLCFRPSRIGWTVISTIAVSAAEGRKPRKETAPTRTRTLDRNQPAYYSWIAASLETDLTQKRYCCPPLQKGTPSTQHDVQNTSVADRALPHTPHTGGKRVPEHRTSCTAASIFAKQTVVRVAETKSHHLPPSAAVQYTHMLTHPPIIWSFVFVKH